MAFIVIEHRGRGDPYFGYKAADLPLGRDGLFLRGAYRRAQEPGC